MVLAGVELPVPDRLTVRGLPVALSVMVTVAVNDAALSGTNAIGITQFEPAASVEPQVVVSEKSVGLVPPRTMPEMLKVAVPTFVIVTV